ncbi:DUF2163 domain-containing protein (plasmid) [Roseomonas mucosa]|uniref:DUF2163 domain-containing protein n=1 Tax=Roseomonas mucosa TaxID=207340 RepID=UPI0030D4AAD1
MRPLSPELKARLASETTSSAWLQRIARRDGVVLGATPHDRPLILDGLLYRPETAFAPSAIETKADMATDSLQLDGILTKDGVNEEDIGAGLYDDARIDIFLADWQHPEYGALHRFRGFVADISCSGGQYSLDARSLSQTLAKSRGRVIITQCDAELGDRRCGVDVASRTIEATVSATDGAHALQSPALDGQPEGWWAYGLVTWTSGANKGSRSEVVSSAGDGLVLRRRPPHPVAPGDTFRAAPGCDKEHATCILRWANGKRFRGFPNVPGADAVLRYPDVPVSS